MKRNLYYQARYCNRRIGGKGDLHLRRSSKILPCIHPPFTYRYEVFLFNVNVKRQVKPNWFEIDFRATFKIHPKAKRDGQTEKRD